MKIDRMWWAVLLGFLATSACTNIPTRIHDSGVEIDPVSNDTGSVRSAAFWQDREGLSLRGDVSPRPANEDLLAGHVDISITSPDESNTVCATAEWGADSKQVLKPFFHRFESLPRKGSRLRVWHHPATTHDDCAS